MAVNDWHAHAQKVDPLAPTSPPALALVVSTPADPTRDARPTHRSLPDSTATAEAARTAEDLVVLTRVLLGLGAHAPAVPAPVLPVEPPVPVEPLIPLETAEPVFVAPPIVEVEPLVVTAPAPSPVRVEPAVVTVDPAVVAVEPVSAPAPPREILDELAFLDL